MVTVISLQPPSLSRAAMDKGSYCLVLACQNSCITIGALGNITFPEGWYVYCGSAQGPGGFARVARHIRVHTGGIPTPRWHIDYILCSSCFMLVAAVLAPNRERETECQIARSLSGDPIAGFGCSDCTCPSHLFFYREKPVNDVLSVFSSLGLTATIQTINKS
jgi:Uri superfamily endonuclease